MDIRGQYNTARVFNDSVESSCIDLIREVCSQKIFQGKKLRIMPDVHAGKGCVIGFTMECSSPPDFVIPNIIGVDIGCGVTLLELGDMSIDLPSLDSFIKKNIPHGHEVNKSWNTLELPREFTGAVTDLSRKTSTDFSRHMCSLGSLGSGNHFIEVAKDDRGCSYLLVHSGSRHLGHQVAAYHQKKAEKACMEKIPKNLSYLQGEGASEYLEDMKICQSYASLNRLLMIRRIAIHLSLPGHLLSVIDEGIRAVSAYRPLSSLGKVSPLWESVHNYIDFQDHILRKGAVPARLGEKLIIPFNMRDGSIVAVGKGNPDWNYSAPHGAGRLLSRKRAKELLSIDHLRDTMKGIYTSSLSEHTLDEAPEAYKSMDEIVRLISPTVDVRSRLRPVYSFKG